jgi:hypothetical protein
MSFITMNKTIAVKTEHVFLQKLLPIYKIL